ncbi:Phytochromobilin:ferredoxin oxidoreductase chloroplastic [Bienertia sinuspersici]
MESLSLNMWANFNPRSCEYKNRGICRNRERKKSKVGTQVFSSLSYQKFVDFAVEETKLRTHLMPSPLQENVSHIQPIDGKAKLNFLSFEASKIRLLRSMHIDGGDTLQVFDFGIFPKVAFDLPIFCANFFTSSTMSIIVLDLNPLHDVSTNKEYKEKYYRSLMPLSIKYAEAWLGLMEEAMEDTAAGQMMRNKEAQHRYLTWRAEKDPGHPMLKRLVGEADASHVLRNFLFNGVDELGSKTFLEYFPEYKLDDGTINQKRSVMGKSCENRPWDNKGELIDN